MTPEERRVYHAAYQKRRRATDPAYKTRQDAQNRANIAHRRATDSAFVAAGRERDRVRSQRPEEKARRRDCMRRWREVHPDEARLRSRVWGRANKAIKLALNKARRARLAGAAGHATAEQIAARVAFYGGRCAYCVDGLFEHVDHVIPLSRGGTGWPANLRPACKPCNLSKHAKSLAEWRARKRAA